MACWRQRGGRSVSQCLRKDPPKGPPKHFLEFPISTGRGWGPPRFLFFFNTGTCTRCRLYLAICPLPWAGCEAAQELDYSRGVLGPPPQRATACQLEKGREDGKAREEGRKKRLRRRGGESREEGPQDTTGMWESELASCSKLNRSPAP